MNREPRRLLPETTAICILTGVVMPVVCFAAAAHENPFQPHGHSAEPATRLVLLLGPNLVAIFWPFMLYSMTCLTFAAIDLPRYAGRFVVRFGLWTGALIACQYFVLILVFVCLDSGALALWIALFFSWFVIAAPLAVLGIWVAARKRFGWRLALLWGVVALTLAVIVFGGPQSLRFLLDTVPMVVLAAGAPWAVAAYLYLAFRAAARVPAEPARRPPGLLILGWLAAYLAAWAISIAII